MAINPMRMDPSRTALLRRHFVSDIRKRFKKLQIETFNLITKHNAFGFVANAPNFQFDTNPKKVKSFNRWLQGQINQQILEISPSTGEPKNQKPWLYKYVQSAYKQGAVRSYIDTLVPDPSKPKAFYAGTQAQFLESAFNRPERIDKLQLLYTRSYENLKAITSTMSGQMSRVFADGVSHGQGAHKIARALSNTITGITKQRAIVLARTEVIHAHAEGQLDGLEDLGIDKVEADVEFSTSDDDGVCPICDELEDKLYTIAQARGVIPVHPNCRCAWIPYVS